MKRFDCLAIDCPLFGPHLLEASAGTGKTFSIEHVFVRLLLESKRQILVEEILAVTFTRASARELKERIYSNLEKAKHAIQSGNEPLWPYLKPHLASDEAIQALDDALMAFDRCQIFTIHGFCYRMLKEFAFEANLGFSLKDPDKETGFSKKIKRAFVDFFEKGIEASSLCPEQISIIMERYSSFDEISRRLMRAQKLKSLTIQESHIQFKAALNDWRGAPIEEPLLQEDFRKLKENYRSKGSVDFSIQVSHLAASFKSRDEVTFFYKLIWEKGSLFSFLDFSNRKVKFKEHKDLNYPGFFDWAQNMLAPIIFEASETKNIFSVLSNCWKNWEEKFLNDENLFQPDEILAQMRRAVDIDSFKAKLRKRYKAAIIDEFQDTDPLQWEIFKTLFLESEEPLRALYLVGDPKQSIYRFRNADVYTYFSARELLGDEHLYHLDANFRSSKDLIGTLNSLFFRKWLKLPKTGGEIPYLPVRAASEVSSKLNDEKAALHWIIADEEASYAESFLPYAISEIEKLEISSFKSIAILVKDRYEAEKALELLRERGIPAAAKNHQPLGKTEIFRSLRDVFKAVISPYDESRFKIVENGPFESKASEFSSWKTLLEEKGLVHFCRQFLGDCVDGDLRQILEILFAWELKEGFSFEGLVRFLDEFETLDAEEGGRRRLNEKEDAVQILTLHVSKGLEFDIVFALGLASSQAVDEEDEEIFAEKLRQLYVAMTRAKKRLYVPLRKVFRKNGSSPVDLFRLSIEADEGPLLAYLEKLSKTQSLSFEEIPTPFPLTIKEKEVKAEIQLKDFHLPRVSFSPKYIHSFTSLAKPKEISQEKGVIEASEEISLDSLPRGPETGIVFHQIFETLFSAPKPIWRDEVEINQIIEKELRFSPLFPWKEVISDIVKKTVLQPLSDGDRTWTLNQLEPDEVCAEMEFLFENEHHFIKGFIDLTFVYEDKFYFIDWKTNFLKESSQNALQEVMQAHDYELQASLYAEALTRCAKEDELRFGGAFYLFVRSGLYVFFEPDMNRLRM